MSTTILQLLKSIRVELDKINLANIPVKLNGRTIDLRNVVIEETDGRYYLNIKFKYDDSVVSTTNSTEIFKPKHRYNG